MKISMKIVFIVVNDNNSSTVVNGGDILHSKCGRVKNHSKRVKVHSFKEPYE